MDTQPNLPATRPRRGGWPLWIALVVLLVIAAGAIVTLGFVVRYLHNEKIQLVHQLERAEAEKQRHELEQKRGAEDAKLLQARNQQDQVLNQARSATNLLMKLLAARDTLLAETAALRTNTAGCTVALHPDLVRLARRFYESAVMDLPPESDLATRLEAVRRIEQQVQDHYGQAYEPPAELSGTVQTHAAWGALAQAKLDQLRQTLNALVSEAKVKFTRATLTAASPTLDAAITKLTEMEARERLQQGEQTVTSARNDAETERAKAEAEKIRADARREAEETRAKVKEESAAKERELQEREAQLKVLEAKTRVVVQDKADEARKVELKKKASDPATQAKLTPFTMPGYYQINEVGSDLQPLSYSKLQNAGALAGDMRGLNRLLTIAWTSADKVRPRWKMNPQLFVRHPNEIEKVKEVQQLLIELGPVLVEMGKLQP